MLEGLAKTHGTDKHSHGYMPYYEEHLSGLREAGPVVLLEVGVAEGASLRTWSQWFQPGSRIVGVDIAPLCHTDPGHFEVITADVKALSNPTALQGMLDVVIDDGSHHSEDMLAGFAILWPRVKPGGWYVIEDLETQWQAGYGGSPVAGGAMVRLLESLMAGTLREHQDAVGEFHAYRQIAFLRKSLDPARTPAVAQHDRKHTHKHGGHEHTHEHDYDPLGDHEHGWHSAPDTCAGDDTFGWEAGPRLPSGYVREQLDGKFAGFIEVPFVPLVVTPYVRVNRAEYRAAEGERLYPWIEVDVSRSQYDYWDLICSMAERDVPFVVVEHDMVPPPGSIDALFRCPEPWCGHSYTVEMGDVVDLFGDLGTLGLTCFKGEALDRVAEVLRGWGPITWSILDGSVYRALKIPVPPATSGLSIHRHYPNAAHLHPYTDTHKAARRAAEEYARPQEVPV